MPNNTEEQIHALWQRMKILEDQLGTTNVSIAQFATDFGKFQADATTFFNDQATFNASLKAFLTSLASGSGGTQLSAADQATINSLDGAISALDNQADTLNTALSGITLPAAPPTPASGS